MSGTPRGADVAECAPVGDDAVAARGQLTVDDAVLIDDAGEVHLRDHFDDSRTADAGDAGGRRRLGKSRFVGPQIRADDLEARFEGCGSMRTRSIAPGAARCRN